MSAFRRDRGPALRTLRSQMRGGGLAVSERKKAKKLKLEIVYIPPGDLVPYEKNTRKHNPEDIEQIKQSIIADGFNDPIGIWGDNIIVEGHGRQIAALEMGLDEVPCIRLDHMTDDQRRDYAIRHNRTAELSVWDFDTLQEEIARLEIEGHDLSGLAFDFGDDLGEAVGNPYTGKINIPQYEPSGEKPPLYSLVDTEKTDSMIEEIDETDLSDDEKDFLKMAAQRHLAFNYKRIADYYATASPEMQEMMEKSALVIIDYDDAIANGYTRLNTDVKEMFEDVEE